MFLFHSIGIYKVEHLEAAVDENKDEDDEEHLIISTYKIVKFYILSSSAYKYVFKDKCLSKKSR